MGREVEPILAAVGGNEREDHQLMPDDHVWVEMD